MVNLPEGEKRRVATEKTLQRYRGRAFDWSKGITCVHLARFHMRNMGHRPSAIPRFRSALGAKKALQERGWASVSDMLDEILPGARIAPAQMLLGDLMVAEGQAGIGAIFICVGPRMMFGWHEDSDDAVIVAAQLDHASAAWRV